MDLYSLLPKVEMVKAVLPTLSSNNLRRLDSVMALDQDMQEILNVF